MVPFYTKKSEKKNDIVPAYNLAGEKDVHQVTLQGRKL